MAARQPIALVGGAIEAYSTGDDIQFNSLGVGRPATGTGGDIRSWGSAVSTFWWTTGNTPTSPTRSNYAQLDNTSNMLSFGGSFAFLSPLRLPDGSLSAPGAYFAGETNTGLRLAAAGDFRAVVAGADVAKFVATGLDLLGGRVLGVAIPAAASDAVRADELNGWLTNTSATPQAAVDTVARFTWADGAGSPQTTEADFELRAPYPCVIDNLHIDATSGPATAGLVFTLRNTGVNTALTATVAAAATQASDVTNSATYAKGDKIAMQVQGATGITSFGSGYRFTMRVRRA